MTQTNQSRSAPPRAGITELDLLLRAVASPARLRVLSLLLRLHRQGDAAGPAPRRQACQPMALASALGLHRSTVTNHLKLLLRLGLVRYVKKDRRKFYALPRLRSGSLRRVLLDRLRDELPARLPRLAVHRPAKAGARRTRPRRHSRANRGPLGPVWRSLTAFSNFRRMLMLPLLLRPGGASLSELAQAADIHPLTVEYHLRKFRRRLMVDVLRRPDAPGRSFRLAARPPTPLQGFVTGFVSSALGLAAPGRP